MRFIATEISVHLFLLTRHSEQSSWHWQSVHAYRLSGPKPSFSTATSKSQSRDNTSVHVCKCVCVWLLHHFPVHSYKPCSVFIDAVYFVLYQINNTTQTWPEEQKREVIHTWVEPICIRSPSTLHLLCVRVCVNTMLFFRTCTLM